MVSMAVSLRIWRAGIAPVLAAAAVFAVPAAAQVNTGEYRALTERLTRLERDLSNLQGVAYTRSPSRTRRSETSGSAQMASNDAVATLTARVNDLEGALRALTGRVEQMEYQMRQMETRMQRLAAASGQVSLGPPQAGYPSQPGAPANLAAAAPQPGPAPGAAQPGAPAPNAQPAPKPRSGKAIPQLTGDEARDFNAARDLLLKGEFARAESMFDAFVKAYPSSKLAGDGQFWKAESLYVRELYQDAAQAYLKVARDYPGSAKAPDSLVKLSLSFNQLGERPQACAALAQLDRRYPNAPERVRQNAQRIRQEFACKN